MLRRRKKVTHDTTCPLCGNTVYYYPEFLPKVSRNYDDIEYVQRGKAVQYFHRSCYIRSLQGGKHNVNSNAE